MRRDIGAPWFGSGWLGFAREPQPPQKRTSKPSSSASSQSQFRFGRVGRGMTAMMPIALLAVLLAMAVPADTPGANSPPERLSGGFIQLQRGMIDLTADDWRRELQAMRDAGLDTVIIQYLQYNDFRFLPETDDAPDPAGRILEIADDLGMTVFLGTKA